MVLKAKAIGVVFIHFYSFTADTHISQLAVSDFELCHLPFQRVSQ